MHKGLRQTIPASKRVNGFKTKPKLGIVNPTENSESVNSEDLIIVPEATETAALVVPVDKRSAGSLVSKDSWDGHDKKQFKRSVRNLGSWF